MRREQGSTPTDLGTPGAELVAGLADPRDIVGAASARDDAVHVDLPRPDPPQPRGADGRRHRRVGEPGGHGDGDVGGRSRVPGRARARRGRRRPRGVRPGGDREFVVVARDRGHVRRAARGVGVSERSHPRRDHRRGLGFGGPGAGVPRRARVRSRRAVLATPGTGRAGGRAARDRRPFHRLGVVRRPRRSRPDLGVHAGRAPRRADHRRARRGQARAVREAGGRERTGRPPHARRRGGVGTRPRGLLREPLRRRAPADLGPRTRRVPRRSLRGAGPPRSPTTGIPPVGSSRNGCTDPTPVAAT